MESVMRLAVPPEQLAAMPSEPTELNLEPLEPTPPPSVSKGMPGVPERRDSPSQPSGRLRAGGNNLAMRSGETSGLIKKDGISAEVEIPEERDTVIIKGDQGIKPPASERERPAPAAPAPSPLQSALSRFLPLALAPHAPRIESVLYLVVGLLFGFLFRGCFK